MPVAPDLLHLGQLVAKTHGWPSAKAFKAYSWTEQDQAGIASCTSQILRRFPATEGKHDLLTATLAFQLQRHLQRPTHSVPVHLVAGTLSVEGALVLGDRLPADGTSPFSANAPDWQGHLWIMIGPHVVDAAIFRLANSPDCPPVLARHVHSLFGPDKAVYVDQWRRSRRIGLEYNPLYVLSEDDISPLLSAAYQLLDEKRANAAS
ncbi:MAG: hypothetical protein E2598_11980 [Sphingobium sp.]|nr:hypothetical protein [Sphingobium sp.]